MDTNEINRAIQYVTARTSYSRDAVGEIIRTGLEELENLAKTTSQSFERETLLKYACCWVISQTGYSEPMVREVLECTGRWLDQTYENIARKQPDLLEKSDS